ncbi:hypothetical protein H8356DRAFT_546486 [Neocallimastix lanati (nom. inval.)]|uniref:Uncharacterized protein n=1 Tax=Neocallimastix californiae TaxID=1754190 RepID=A0A1Y2EP30_9FUNG|nr:hypothetical protein H8356DRAFT_546486 [Neocallimastix sp. JGI-2020a]ORY73287.1 hypothetical protein LY90DRAFT_176165 [Neocallimastix californiae]|eukprot:ORY73287.1 hypothetical protein LY90DRAFT_176165 [Neocallimastix californiae]
MLYPNKPINHNIYYNDYVLSLDQSDLIIADENYLDSEVPVISCNISIIGDDLAKLNEKNNKKLDVVTEEILLDNEMDIIENSSSELKFINNQDINNNNGTPLIVKKDNSKDPIEIANKHENATKDKKEDNNKDRSKNKNKNKNKIDNENIDENEDKNIIMKNNFKIKEANQSNNENFNTYPKEGIKSVVNQKDDFTKIDSSDPNIPIPDRLDSKITNNKDDYIIKKSEGQEVIKNSLNKTTNSVNQDSVTTSSTASHNKNKHIIHKKKKYDSKTIFSFIFLQSFIIFATAISVILTIEKMLGIRIIMKFVDIFLEDEHYIKEESSPS